MKNITETKKTCARKGHHVWDDGIMLQHPEDLALISFIRTCQVPDCEKTIWVEINMERFDTSEL